MKLNFKTLLVIFVIWRVVLFVVVAIAPIFLNYRPDFEYTNITYFSKHSFFTQPVVNTWANFDGIHYLAIAGRGYVDEGRFFPLWPMLIKAVTPYEVVFSPLQFILGLVLSHLFFAGGVFFFYQLVKKDFSQKVAFLSTLALILFPTSFFFVSIFSESVFFFLVMLTFWFALQKHWRRAVLCAAFVAATRFVGIFILPVVLYEFFVQENITFQNWRTQWQKLSKLVLFAVIPSGLFAFSVFNYQRWGSWFYFLKSHGELANGRSVDSIVTPVHTLWRYAKILTSLPVQQYEWWVAALEVVLFFFVTGLLILGWKQQIRRSYLLFGACCFFFPAFSGTFTGIPRYALAAFPIFISIGLIQNKYVRWAYFFVSLVLTILLMAAFSRGYFVA